jgi:hypothetical protein
MVSEFFLGSWRIIQGTVYQVKGISKYVIIAEDTSGNSALSNTLGQYSLCSSY